MYKLIPGTLRLMNKQKFARLFYEAVEKAALDAEKFLERKIPRHVGIELHGANYSGVIITPDEAIDILFIDSNTFYRIIDFAVTSVTEEQTTVFVRASAHEPGPFERTWNNPPGTGPFKQIGPNLNLQISPG
jgi:hypothetical protein